MLKFIKISILLLSFITHPTFAQNSETIKYKTEQEKQQKRVNDALSDAYECFAEEARVQHSVQSQIIFAESEKEAINTFLNKNDITIMTNSKFPRSINTAQLTRSVYDRSGVFLEDVIITDINCRPFFK